MIKKIVITGAPCSGKSTIIESLKNNLNQQNKIVYLEECARELIQKFDIKATSPNFQTVLFAYQLYKENNIIKENSDADYLLVQDRSLIDGMAYTTPEIWSDISKNTDIKNRYDYIIYLSLPSNEHYINDSARCETYESACIIAEKLRYAYESLGYKLIIVPDCESIDKKIQLVIQEIRKIMKNSS